MDRLRLCGQHSSWRRPRVCRRPAGYPQDVPPSPKRSAGRPGADSALPAVADPVAANARTRRALDALHARPVNYDPSAHERLESQAGWKRETRCQPLPREPPGPPIAGGSWEIARELMRDYEFADPSMVRAVYQPDAPLEGRDMLLVVRFLFLRLRVGVRVGGVLDETRSVDGRTVRLWGWNYRTLRGHFEMGQMDYEVWKWQDTGEVEFRVRGYWRPGGSRNPLIRLGFRLFGPRQRERFYAAAARRIVELTTARLEGLRADARPRVVDEIAAAPKAR